MALTIVLSLITVACVALFIMFKLTEKKKPYNEDILAEVELGVWEFPAEDFKVETEKCNIIPPLTEKMMNSSKSIVIYILNSYGVPEKYHDAYTSNSKIKSYFTKAEQITHNQIISAIEKNYHKLNGDSVAFAAGLKKAKMIMPDILANENIHPHYRSKYLSNGMITKCFTEAEALIKAKKEKARADELAKIKAEEMRNAEKLSYHLTNTGKEKAVHFAKKQIEYYQYKIAECDAELQAALAKASGNVDLGPKKETWAYVGGAASAIAGPVAGVMMAADAKRRDEERNQLSAARTAISIQLYALEKNQIESKKSDYSSRLRRWEQFLEDKKYQLEEWLNPTKLLEAINPQVVNYNVSDTGTITLRVNLSCSKSLRIFGGKPAYVDGSIRVNFLKNGKKCGSTILYLPFQGVIENVTCTCICTSIPKLSNGNEKYDIEFSPNKLWALEITDVASYIRHMHPEEAVDWHYEISHQKNDTNEITQEDNVNQLRKNKDVQEKLDEWKSERDNQNKKIRIYEYAALAVFAVSLTLLFTLGIPNARYEHANKLLSNGDYYEAGQAFDDLKTYKDSYDMAVESYALAGRYDLIVNSFGLTEIVIPEGVTSISDEAFKNLEKLTSVVIPNSVTSIGDYAFYGCESLTSVVIGDSVTTIGDSAFYGCNNLTSIVIGDSVTTIGDYTFYGCNSLTSVVIGDSVTAIGDYAFYGCDSLTSAVIPDSVTSISDFAFTSCDSLTSVVIGDSVTAIGDYAFNYCFNLKDVYITNVEAWLNIDTDNYGYVNNYATLHILDNEGNEITNLVIPDSITSIPKFAFKNAKNITSVTIPDSVTSIGDWAFEGCDSLTSITIPDSVTSIGHSAFKNCSSLTSITIPDSVTSIGEGAFSGCSSLENMVLPFIGDSLNTLSNNKQYPLGYIFGTSRSPDSEKTEQRIYDTLESYTTEEYYIPSSLKNVTITGGNITNSAFWNCTNIENVIIGDGISSIGYAAFYECSSLANITIPESVTRIDDYAFYGCSDLTHIVIPNTVTSIGYAAFYECSSLANITIPESVTSIDDYAFYGCSDLAHIEIPNTVTCIGEAAFYGCHMLTNIVIPDSTTSIGYGAFGECSALVNVTLSESIASISDYAFYGCSDLTNISIPDGVTSIGTYAFGGCTNLTKIIIPNSVIQIGYSAFYGCSSLESITLPFIGDSKKTSSDTYQYPLGYIFGEESYDGSIKTTQYYYGSSLTSSVHTNFYIPKNLKSITITGGNILFGALNNCSTIVEIVIEDTVTSIGDWAFSGCSGLTSITIPDSVTRIGERAFHSCSGLTNIIIPNSVTHIGKLAFYGCSKLESMTIPFAGATKNGTSSTNFGYIFGADTFSSNNKYVPNSLKTVVITGGTSINDYAFYGCSSLISITIPESATSIGISAFNGCSGLTGITIPDGVTSIGLGAFNDCSSLTSVVIPDSVTSIGSYAFDGCSSLTEAVFIDTSTWYYYIYGFTTRTISLEVPGQNAKYLTTTYCDYDLYKK